MNPGLIRIEQNIPVDKLLDELNANSHLWKEYVYRSAAKDTPHSAVADIWLRYNDLNKFAPNDLNDMMQEHDSVWYEAIDYLPSFKALAMMLMTSLNGERLGGMLITRLPAGESIAAHVDKGWHSEYYKKYHLILSGTGSVIYSGQTFLTNKPGDLFLLDSSQPHGVINNGEEDRIAVIICIRSDSGFRVTRRN